MTADDTAKFLDGGKLPCILVETKSDLLEPDVVDDTTALKEFAEKNEYDGCFRTSSKSGTNIKESMDHLIFKIIERMEAMEAGEGKDVFTADRKSVVLDKEKHTKVRDKKNHDSCC